MGSFLKFFVGFTLFISISFGVTFAVNEYTLTKSVDEQAAAALQAMLEMHY